MDGTEGKGPHFRLGLTFEPGTGKWSGHWGTLRTNLMVTDAQAVDLGAECTRLCVSSLMQQLHWESAVADALRLYPAH